MTIILKSLAKSLIPIYVIFCLTMFLMQRNLMYKPEKHILSPKQYGLENFKEINVVSEDGIALQTWFLESKNKNAPLLVYFHGNAQNISGHFELLNSFAQLSDYSILAINYRGYGRSGGKPSEKGLYKDGRAVLNYALKNLSKKQNDIVVYGISLGSAVAVKAATEFKNVRAVILQSPFTSMSNIAQEIYWYLPAKILTIDRFDSLGRIKKVKSPILLIHGNQDKLIPARHSEQLKNASKNAQLVILKDATHNDFDSKEIVKNVKNFVNQF